MMDFKEIAGTAWQRKNKSLFSMMQLIWENPGLNRAEASRRHDSSKVAVTNCVNKLLELRIVEEGAAVESKRGRRPVALRFRRDLFHSVGVSLHDGHMAQVCLTNAAGETVAEQTRYIETVAAEDKCRAVMDMIREVAGTSLQDALGIGISLTGILNPETGRVVSSAQIPGATDFDLAGHLKHEFGKPVQLINMSHLLPLLELRLGKAKGMSSFLYIDHGYGLGMVLNGKLYRGHQACGGELGFLRIRDYGKTGSDGRNGLFATVAPTWKVTDKLEEIIAANGNTLVKKHLRPETSKVTLDMVVKAIKEGDMLCARLLGETFQVIGEVALDLAYLFNPEAIFFEPWTADCPECSIDIVKSQMSHYGVCHWGLKTEVLSASCGKESLAPGAAMLPVDAVFSK